MEFEIAHRGPNLRRSYEGDATSIVTITQPLGSAIQPRNRGGAMFNLRSLDLNLLTVFEAVYELGTVSGAADRLALSQSAASHALARLREACSDDLFVRARQGLAPTPVARTMYPSIKRALEALRGSLADAIGFDPARAHRRFRISIPYSMGPFFALDLRAAAAAVAPRVVLSFDTVSRPVDLEHNLRDGFMDIAIDWLPIVMDPFVNERLFDDRLMLLARTGHPLVDSGVTLEDLTKMEFVTLHRRREGEHLPQAIREFYKLGVREVVRVSELLQIPIVVANTDLLGIGSLSMARLMERSNLRILSFPIELPAVPIYMIWHESRRNDTAHSWLREVVATELSRVGGG